MTEKLTSKQKAALGVALIVVPGAALAVGTYLLYTGIKKVLNESKEERAKRQEEYLDKLYPKWKCPHCKDWFHMPWKNCQCGGSGGK